MKIYVSVGTHEQSFQRLLDTVASTIQSTDHAWVVQYGSGSWDIVHPNSRASRYLSAAEVTETLDWADIIVSQASPGNVFGALEASVWPIVLGREKKYGEHVDDHQVRFARALEDMHLSTNMVDPGSLPMLIDREQSRSVDERRELIRARMLESRNRRALFRAEAWSIILGLID